MTEDERGLWGRYDRKELILFYMPQVKLQAERIARSANWTNLKDLIQDGVGGLVKAIERFDPRRGTPFIAFARPYIRGAIFDGAELNRGMARKPEELHREIRRAEAELTKTLQRSPTIAEIAGKTGLTLEQIRNALDAMALAFAGELPDAEDSTAAGGVHTGNQEREAMIEEALSRLGEKEQEVISLYFWEGLTDKEVAARLGLTGSNATKIRQRALGKLRKQLGAE